MTIPLRPRAVVTGAGGGLGRAFALALAEMGGRIIVSDVNVAGAEETATACRNLGAEAFAQACDVSHADQVEALAVRADKEFGGCDVVVNNAGVSVAGNVGEIPLEDWNWIVSINLMGVVYGCHSFAQRFKKQGSGHVINVASAAGLIAAASMAPYNATKFGVVGLSESMYLELKPHNVGVTVLCPTFFPTNIVESGRVPKNDPAANMARALMSQSPLDANDVAKATLRAARHDELYCIPMVDGKLAWAAKRFWPARFYQNVVPFMQSMLKRRYGYQ